MKVGEALGYGPEDRLLLVNADDFGMCRAGNEAIKQLLEEKAISSTTLMMPCPWAKEAALWSASHPNIDVGVHLTLTSEWAAYKWGPVTRDAATDSLVTQEGYFPESVLPIEQNAEDGQLARELRNQIELALRMGVDVTHLDNHMLSVYGPATGRHFLHPVLDLCREYGLPFRMSRHPRVSPGELPSPELVERTREQAGMADERGVVIVDYIRALPFSTEPEEAYESFRNQMVELIRSMQPGVSEIILHPARATEELAAIHEHAARREMEFHVFRDPLVQAVLQEENIRLIQWRDLRNLQRGKGAGRAEAHSDS
ncbi:polysaccharide deacetylase family protein [Gorillibacterium sp. CAU 1737]|uniref:polysaccharide deacetylase family protein n=1 Tax=Gorillibacterium sp. CAU 1737 TaxID=3140362 RepID=UPI003260F165